MNPKQLKRLIKEVIREVEAGDESTSEQGGKERNFTHPLAIKYGSDSPILSFTLGGSNKNNTQKLKDFIGLVAYEAGKRQLELIHAELEKDGKLGIDMDSGEIKKSAEEINQELDFIAAQMEKEKKLKGANMSSDERLAQIKTGEKEPEWKAATDKDMETQRINARKRAAMEKAGTLKLDPTNGLPVDTDLWTDKDWELWDTGQKSTGNQSYRKASTTQGRKGMISPGLSNYLAKTPSQYQAK